MVNCNLLAIILSIISITIANAQKEYVIGKITDIETQQPIEYAAVTISGSMLGALTDENGQFTLQNVSIKPDARLLVSHIAYENQTISLENPESLNIKLTPISVQLHEVTVKPVNIKKFMGEVIRHHHSTIQKKQYMSKGFVREYAKLNDRYVAYYEAYGYLISSGYDFPIATDNFNFVPTNFRKARSSKKWFEYGYDVEENASDYIPFIGYSSLFSQYRHIENSWFLSEKKWHKYQFALDSISYENGITNWVIKFEGKRNKKKFYHSGKIYVNAGNKVISKIEVETSFFSFPFHQWVSSVNFSMDFVEFNNQTYFAGIKARYTKENLFHALGYRLMQVNFQDVNIPSITQSLLTCYDYNPVVYYDSLAWTQTGISEFSDMDNVKRDLSPEEPMESQFKSFHDTYYRGKNELDKSTVMLFVGALKEFEKMFFNL